MLKLATENPVVRINEKELSQLKLMPKTKDKLAELRKATKLDSDEIIYNGLLYYEIELNKKLKSK